MNAKGKAFKEILTDLHKTLQMSALPDISDDMTGNELVTVYKSTKLTSHQLSCLSTLGVQLDDNWSQEVPILDNTFFTAYRFPINVAARSAHRTQSTGNGAGTSQGGPSMQGGDEDE